MSKGIPLATVFRGVILFIPCICNNNGAADSLSTNAFVASKFCQVKLHAHMASGFPIAGSVLPVTMISIRGLLKAETV